MIGWANTQDEVRSKLSEMLEVKAEASPAQGATANACIAAGLSGDAESDAAGVFYGIGVDSDGQ